MKFKELMTAASFLYRMEKLDKRAESLKERSRNGDYSDELIKELLDVIKERRLLTEEIYGFRVRMEFKNRIKEIINETRES